MNKFELGQKLYRVDFAMCSIDPALLPIEEVTLFRVDLHLGATEHFADEVALGGNGESFNHIKIFETTEEAEQALERFKVALKDKEHLDQLAQVERDRERIKQLQLEIKELKKRVKSVEEFGVEVVC